MFRSSLFAFAMLVGTTPGLLAQGSAKEQPWIRLFNGKNLDGWTAKIKGYKLGENYGNTFRVTNGNLQVAYDEYD